jgi:hypothetical protein
MTRVNQYYLVTLFQRRVDADVEVVGDGDGDGDVEVLAAQTPIFGD